MKAGQLLKVVLIIALFVGKINAGWGKFWKKVYCKIGFDRYCGSPPKVAPPPCSIPSKTSDDFERETVDKIDQGLFNEIQIVFPTLNLNKNLTVDVPYLVNEYFFSFIDPGQEWDLDDFKSYYTFLELTLSVHSEVRDIYNKTLQAAINASKLSSLSDASLAGYVQQIVSGIVADVPLHCEDDTDLNQVEKIMTDICIKYHSFDIKILKDATKNFIDNMGINNITLSGIELRDLANLILSTDDNLDKLLKTMDNRAREDTLNSLRGLIIHSIDYTDNIKYDTILDLINKSVERMNNQRSSQSKVIQSFDNIEKIIRKSPNEPFNLTIEDLIINKNPDTFFHSLHPATNILPINTTLPNINGSISTTSFFLSSTAPSTLGFYTYSIPFTTTTSKSSSNSTLIFTVIVCSSQNVCQTSSSPSNLVLHILIGLSSFLALVIVVMAACCCRRKCCCCCCRKQEKKEEDGSKEGDGESTYKGDETGNKMQKHCCYEKGDILNFGDDFVDPQHTQKPQTAHNEGIYEQSLENKNENAHKNNCIGINFYQNNSEFIETSKEEEENTKDKDAKVQQKIAWENECNNDAEEKNTCNHSFMINRNQSKVIDLSEDIGDIESSKNSQAGEIKYVSRDTNKKKTLMELL